MEKVNMAGGLRGFLQMAGRALIAFKRASFCVKEVGKRDYENKVEKDSYARNLLCSADHFISL
jgi:hypothetical protein